MIRHGDLFNAHQQARFMRPDAARYVRPDVSRWLTPPHPDEQKYSPDQPRDERGRWTDGDGTQDSNGAPLIQNILARAEKLDRTGSPADYAKCVNLCFPILERFSRPGSDRNYWDFQKCMNACLGINR